MANLYPRWNNYSIPEPATVTHANAPQASAAPVFPSRRLAPGFCARQPPRMALVPAARPSPLAPPVFFVTHAEMGGPGPSIQFGSPFSGFARFSFFSGPGFFICTWGYVAVLSFVRCFFCVKGGSTVTVM